MIAISEMSNSRPRTIRRNALMITGTSSKSKVERARHDRAVLQRLGVRIRDERGLAGGHGYLLPDLSCRSGSANGRTKLPESTVFYAAVHFCCHMAGLFGPNKGGI